MQQNSVRWPMRMKLASIKKFRKISCVRSLPFSLRIFVIWFCVWKKLLNSPINPPNWLFICWVWCPLASQDYPWCMSEWKKLQIAWKIVLASCSGDCVTVVVKPRFPISELPWKISPSTFPAWNMRSWLSINIAQFITLWLSVQKFDLCQWQSRNFGRFFCGGWGTKINWQLSKNSHCKSLLTVHRRFLRIPKIFQGQTALWRGVGTAGRSVGV